LTIFFEGKDLIAKLPVESKDMVVYVDTTNEPTTDSIDGYTDKVKAFLNGVAPCALLAFGGGCVLDTCKCVGNLLNNPGKAENYQGWELVKNPAPYKIAVPTLSGTGSETSRTGIICNEEKNIKLGMNSDYTMFEQVLLDPDLTASVPRNQYFYTGIDTYMHCFESITGSYRNVVVDSLAEKAIDLSKQVYLSSDMMSDENREKAHDRLLPGRHGRRFRGRGASPFRWSQHGAAHAPRHCQLPCPHRAGRHLPQ
jgi:Alcohol dehydrogenase, class IV